MSGKSEACLRVVEVMRAGGYYDAVMAGDAELDRVKAYLRAFAGEHESTCGHLLQNPGYPCFPGLRHAPFRERSAAPGAALLEQSFAVIRDEFRSLSNDDYLRYTPPSMTNEWAVYLFWYMGVELEAFAQRCPRTSAILRALPRVCLDYPWGDALFSVHKADAHLRAHCSIDNLRVRAHLGIEVPEGSEMRVGSEIRTWREGKALLFEDSFVHEVWNRGTSRRAILIVDFWHPDLTDVEIRALTAGFRKAEVRRLFLLERIGMVDNVPPPYIEYLRSTVPQQENDPLLREYWKH